MLRQFPFFLAATRMEPDAYQQAGTERLPRSFFVTGMREMKRLFAIFVTITCFTLPALSAAGPDEDYEVGRKAAAEGDFQSAVVSLRLAAAKNHLAAQLLLARIADDAGEHEVAAELLRKVAEQGHPEGEFEYGNMFLKGTGVPVDPAEGRKWYIRAAEKNFVPAINGLASAYVSGGLGLSDAERGEQPEALRWIRTAAGGGYPEAIAFLATRAMKPGNDDPEGLVWVRKVAESGNLVAMTALAEAFRNGGRWGLAVDLVEANKWDAAIKAARKPKRGRR